MPARSTPKTRQRKKSLLTRIKQSYRVHARALAGPPKQAVDKEYLPLIEKLIEEESIANTSRDVLQTIVREKARERVRALRKELHEKMHRLALARALTLAGIYSPAKRQMIRIKMNFISYHSSKERAMEIVNTMMRDVGWRFKVFYKNYDKTMNFNEKYVNKLYTQIKMRNKQTH